MNIESSYRPTQARIHLDAIEHNMRQLIRFLPQETAAIAVVKADGYGHGAVETANAALQAGASMLAVATPEEAIELREGQIQAELLVLGISPVSFAEVAADQNITLTVSSAKWIGEAANCMPVNKKMKLHVKIDSGMGRIGVRTERELSEIIQAVNRTSNVTIDGAFTHFACADEEDPAYTLQQFQQFQQLVRLFPEKPRMIHAANSAATFMFPQFHLDAVRFGISLYGIAPSPYVDTHLPFPLQKALTLETELVHVKQLRAGERISYGGTYKTAGNEWIGTLPIGYADGLKRSLTGQEVIIAGTRVPIVGRICMDQCMIQLPEEYAAGEKVTLIGRQGDEEVTMEEWAARLGTIPYEIAVTFSKRIPRVYN